MGSPTQLPHSMSPNLQLTHPTADECIKIWTETFSSWRDSLTLPLYLKESQFLTTVPLADDGGMTAWILVDKTLAPNHRPILCSCETFRKRSLTSDANGALQETIVHGIASVFCPPRYRNRGYAARHMAELAKRLRDWQSDYGQVIGTILYSDIGKWYYANLGWKPNANNWHLCFAPAKMEWPAQVEEIAKQDLGELCRRDEHMMRAAIQQPDGSGKRRRVMVLADLNHMFWHISKEEFVCQHVFGKTPGTKGAIAGIPGRQVWAIWTHRYYGNPKEMDSNVLYILRLVMEGDETANKVSGTYDAESLPTVPKETEASLYAVLQAAQSEAAKWELDHVKLWEPSPLVQSLIAQQGLDYVRCEREEDSVASVMWYDDGGQESEDLVWINNEYYAWC